MRPGSTSKTSFFPALTSHQDALKIFFMTLRALSPAMPANLRQLLRPVALTLPDLQQVAELTLLGAGIRDASRIARPKTWESSHSVSHSQHPLYQPGSGLWPTMHPRSGPFSPSFPQAPGSTLPATLTWATSATSRPISLLLPFCRLKVRMAFSK